MRYIGSKASTINEVYKLSSKYVCEGTFCDPFGGTATVSSFFKEKGFKVFAGDLLRFAHYIQIAKLSSNTSFTKLKSFLNIETKIELCNYLNSLIVYRGWFIENYSKKRKFFTLTNARKIQGLWNAIIRFDKLGLLTYKERAVLLASLVNSVDVVANTAGTYYAYLKRYDRKAKKDFIFKLIAPVKGKHSGKSFNCDALQLVKQADFDILYLDPPYNERKYHAYYHLPETIANCVRPKLTGHAGLAKWSGSITSNFYHSKSALNSLEEILRHANFKILIFHYCDKGLIQPNILQKLFKRFKYIVEMNLENLGYTTKKTNRKSFNHLYILSNAVDLTKLG
jgi:adenine-specific DNA-methyltransferase